MHVMGFPEIQMRTRDLDEEGDTIIEIIRYVCGGGKPIGVGHVLADEHGPRFQVVAVTQDDFGDHSPMHNPFGRLKIVSARDIAQAN